MNRVDDKKRYEIVDIDQPLMDKHGPLPLIRWHESLPEPTKWLIHGVLPTNSCAVVGAEQKTGKTWLTILFALCMAFRRPVLGEWDAKTAGKTLIYSPEGGYEAMKRRLWAMCWGLGLDPVHAGQQIALLPGPIHIDNQIARVRLKATIEEFQPHLLIMDPLISIHSGERDENTTSIQPILEEIRGIIKHAPGMSIIICHHFNKAAKTATSMLNQLRGSNALSAWLDSAILLTKENDEPGAIRNVHVMLRDEESPQPCGFRLKREFLREVDGEELPKGLWSMLLDPCEPFDTKPNGSSKGRGDRLDLDVMHAVETILKNAPDGLSAYAVANEAEITRPRAGRFLEALKEKGLADKGGDGRWRKQ